MEAVWTDNLLTENFYILGIAALFPLMAGLVVLQTNPYQALVIRGILGAIAALVYTLFGAADVALTEALVGTFLSITLYAIAVRSSLRMRLGILQAETDSLSTTTSLFSSLRLALNKYHMQLEIIPYRDHQALKQALMDKEIHASYVRLLDPEFNNDVKGHLQLRIKRLYSLMQTQLLSAQPSTQLSYVDLTAETFEPPQSMEELA